MGQNEYVVRIVEPSSKPALPKPRPILRIKPIDLLKKRLNILFGSGIGLMAGIVIYLMLNSLGISLGSLESSIIVGFPALLGIITSFAIL